MNVFDKQCAAVACLFAMYNKHQIIRYVQTKLFCFSLLICQTLNRLTTAIKMWCCSNTMITCSLTPFVYIIIVSQTKEDQVYPEEIMKGNCDHAWQIQI